MNLDDLSAMQALDSQNLLSEIDSLPDLLAQAWALGQNLPLADISGVTNIVITGLGDPAVGAELLAGYAADACELPVSLHRDYGLPAHARGKETLVIAVCHSSKSEETLSAFQEAVKRGCRLMVISSDGLVEEARAAGCPGWRFPQQAPAVFCFGLLLAAFARLGLIPAQEALVAEAVAAMKAQQITIQAQVGAANNPAKRYAGQLVGRWVTIFGSGVLAAVARRWKNQINLLAKAPANVELLPEAKYNSLTGIFNPAEEVLMPHTMTLFLRAASDHPGNMQGANTTRQAFMLEGLNTDVYLAQGNNRLAQMWTAIHFGDYLAYYLAIAYSMDPGQ